MQIVVDLIRVVFFHWSNFNVNHESCRISYQFKKLSKTPIKVKVQVHQSVRRPRIKIFKCIFFNICYYPPRGGDQPPGSWTPVTFGYVFLNSSYYTTGGRLWTTTMSRTKNFKFSVFTPQGWDWWCWSHPQVLFATSYVFTPYPSRPYTGVLITIIKILTDSRFWHPPGFVGVFTRDGWKLEIEIDVWKRSTRRFYNCMS